MKKTRKRERLNKSTAKKSAENFSFFLTPLFPLSPEALT